MMKQFMLAKNIIASNFSRLNFPYKLTFVATYKCQSRCIHCKIWGKKPVNELSLHEIESFFKKSNKFSWVDLTGGEVTLRNDFVDIANAIITNCKDLYHLHTPTNGLAPALIEKKMRQIMELKPNWYVITVSLDGPRELNDKLRGVKGHFDKVVDTVKRLREIKQKNFEVFIGFTLSASNKGTFQQMISQVREEIPDIQPDDFHMNVVHVSGHYFDNVNTSALNADLRKDVKEYKESRNNKLSQMGFLENQYLRLVDQYLQTGKTPITCQALSGSVFLDSFGYIYPCTIYSKKLVNIKDINYDLEEYWSTNVVKDIRKDIKNGKCPHCWTPCEAYQSILANLKKVRVYRNKLNSIGSLKMKILVLTSRYTATRDIISEDFGRQTRLFEALRKLGHKIDFFVVDYIKHENKNLKLHGINVAIRAFGIFYFFRFLKNLNRVLKNKNYDVLIATSDPLWGVIGYIFTKIHKIRFIYDLHDNYEVYFAYKLPFFRLIDSYIIKKADIITTVSYSLKEKIRPIRKKKVFVVQNGADLKLFKPMDKLRCRNSLNLPKNAKLIVYTGSIQRLQGIDLLVEVFNELKKEVKNLKLAIAGRFFKGEEKKIDLKQKGIIYLKSLLQKEIVKLINAADVVVVPNPENAFTKYCFPYKVIEYMACNKPIVATKIGDVKKVLEKYPDALCLPDNKEDMKDKIKKQLNLDKKDYRKLIEKNSWDNIALKLDGIIKN